MTSETPQRACDSEAPQAPSRHHGGICPNCGTPGVHRSHRKGLTERLLSLAGARARRCHACHACNGWFARLFSSTVHTDDARRALRRAAILLLMLAGAALVLLDMLWLMNKQAAISPSEVLLEFPAHNPRPVLSRTLPA